MKTVHLLLDTKDKREYAVCLMLLFGLLMECVMNVLFLSRVLPIDRLESLYNLIPVAQYGMIGRMVIAVFHLTSFHIGSVVLAIVKNTSVSFWLLLAGSGYVLLSDYPSKAMKLTKKTIGIVMLWSVVVLALVLWYVLFRLQISSYQAALYHVLILAGILLVSIVVGGLIVLIGWIRVMLGYMNALQYDAIELETLQNQEESVNSSLL